MGLVGINFLGFLGSLSGRLWGSQASSSATGFLLLETGDFLLLEDGGKIII